MIRINLSTIYNDSIYLSFYKIKQKQYVWNLGTKIDTVFTFHRLNKPAVIRKYKLFNHGYIVYSFFENDKEIKEPIKIKLDVI